jgi:hypothetical protein
MYNIIQVILGYFKLSLEILNGNLVLYATFFEKDTKHFGVLVRAFGVLLHADFWCAIGTL